MLRNKIDQLMLYGKQYKEKKKALKQWKHRAETLNVLYSQLMKQDNSNKMNPTTIPMKMQLTATQTFSHRWQRSIKKSVVLVNSYLKHALKYLQSFVSTLVFNHIPDFQEFLNRKEGQQQIQSKDFFTVCCFRPSKTMTITEARVSLTKISKALVTYKIISCILFT